MCPAVRGEDPADGEKECLNFSFMAGVRKIRPVDNADVGALDISGLVDLQESVRGELARRAAALCAFCGLDGMCFACCKRDGDFIAVTFQSSGEARAWRRAGVARDAFAAQGWTMTWNGISWPLTVKVPVSVFVKITQGASVKGGVRESQTGDAGLSDAVAHFRAATDALVRSVEDGKIAGEKC